jgi:hypothetical protein
MAVTVILGVSHQDHAVVPGDLDAVAALRTREAGRAPACDFGSHIISLRIFLVSSRDSRGDSDDARSRLITVIKCATSVGASTILPPL